MCERTYNVIEGPSPIKAWTKGVELGDRALQQLKNVASMPFVYKWVAAMPDAHWDMGATVGSVIATKGAIIPAAVGVDLGCGMVAVETNLTANDLPDNLAGIRSAIEQAVPHGRTDNGGRNDRGAWHDLPEANTAVWDQLKSGYEQIIEKQPRLDRGNHVNHLCTLGTGNHFIEVCLDESNQVWIMLHSGSRGVGNRQSFREPRPRHRRARGGSSREHAGMRSLSPQRQAAVSNDIQHSGTTGSHGPEATRAICNRSGFDQRTISANGARLVRPRTRRPPVVLPKIWTSG